MINEVETRKMELIEYDSLVDGVKDIYNEFIDKPLNEKKSKTETEAKGIEEEEEKKEYTGNSNDNNIEEDDDDKKQIPKKRKMKNENVKNGESKKIRTSSAFPLSSIPSVPPSSVLSVPLTPIAPVPPIPPSNVKAKCQDDDEDAVIISLIEFNKKIRNEIKDIQFLNDLNDYLVDISYYYYEKGNNVRDEDKNYEDIIKVYIHYRNYYF